MPKYTREEKGHLKNLEEVMKFDDYAHAVALIDTNHRHVHDGFYFHASGRATLGIAGTLDLLLNVPAGCYPHVQDVLFNLGDAPADIGIYRGVTTSDDGTAVTVHNRNLNSSTTPEAVLTHTPTITDLGTQIHDRYIGDTGGTGINKIGAFTPSTGEEWVFAPGEKYLVRLTNNSGASMTVSYEAFWYEIGYSK